MTKHQTQLTSSEIASIWTGYMNDSMSKCILSYFLKQIEDEDIRPVIQFAYDISFKHLGVPPTKRGKHTLSQFLDEINRLFPMLRN